MMIVMLATNLDSNHRGTVMPETKTKILVCNAGSSSLKFSLFDAEDELLLADGWHRLDKKTNATSFSPSKPAGNPRGAEAGKTR